MHEIFEHCSRGSPEHEHLDLGRHSYPCAHLRIWSRQTFQQYPLGTALIFRQYSLGTVLIFSPGQPGYSRERMMIEPS